VGPGVDHVWHQFVVRHPERDSLREALAAAGIETLIHYETPPHRQAAYADLGFAAGSFPIAELLSAEILSLPIDPLLSPAAVDAVVATIQAWDAGRRANRSGAQLSTKAAVLGRT
jgi:dTDP-4-amino-4,6-dideoxygalactose transaminase